MTTIKEEILKDFDRNWIKPWKDNNFGVPNAHFTIKDFLIQSIDKVVEESIQQQIKLLEEIKKELEKYKGNDTNDFIGGENYVVENFGEDLDSKITNLKKEL